MSVVVVVVADVIVVMRDWRAAVVRHVEGPVPVLVVVMSIPVPVIAIECMVVVVAAVAMVSVVRTIYCKSARQHYCIRYDCKAEKQQSQYKRRVACV